MQVMCDKDRTPEEKDMSDQSSRIEAIASHVEELDDEAFVNIVSGNLFETLCENTFGRCLSASPCLIPESVVFDADGTTFKARVEIEIDENEGRYDVDAEISGTLASEPGSIPAFTSLVRIPRAVAA
jgi:hypothetical protein